MNPKHIQVRMDRDSGDLWLFNAQTRRRIKNINSDVLLCMCADLDGAALVERDVIFTEPDDRKWTVRVTVERKELENE